MRRKLTNRQRCGGKKADSDFASERHAQLIGDLRGDAGLADGEIEFAPLLVQGMLRVGFSGGAIFNWGTLTVTNSTFSGNHATGNGGAIVNSYAPSLTVVNSTFTENEAQGTGGNPGNGGCGGTIYQDGADEATTLCGVTIHGNRAGAIAGGVFRVSNDHTGTMTVDLSTVDGNEVGAGDGNVAALVLPPLPALPGTRAFGPTASEVVTRSGGRLGGTRTVETVVVPEREGTLEVPPLAWPFFSPRTGRYELARTEPVRVALPLAAHPLRGPGPGRAARRASPRSAEGEGWAGARSSSPSPTRPTGRTRATCG